MITGYDVSKHQGHVDHEAFRDAGFRFCMIKCSEGVDYQDDRYRENVEGVLRAGLDFGSYHFARISLQNTPSKDVKALKKEDPAEFERRLLADAAAEANSHVNLLDRRQNMPSCVDVEWDKRVAAGISPLDSVKWCRAWIEVAREKTARMPLFYTGRSFWRFKLGKSLALSHCPLWQADYTGKAKKLGHPRVIDGWPAVAWQKTGKAPRPDKASGKVDFNVWMETEEAYLDLVDGTDQPREVPEMDLTEQPAWARAIMDVMQRFATSARLEA